MGRGGDHGCPEEDHKRPDILSVLCTECAQGYDCSQLCEFRGLYAYAGQSQPGAGSIDLVAQQQGYEQHQDADSIDVVGKIIEIFIVDVDNNGHQGQSCDNPDYLLDELDGCVDPFGVEAAGIDEADAYHREAEHHKNNDEIEGDEGSSAIHCAS